VVALRAGARDPRRPYWRPGRGLASQQSTRPPHSPGSGALITIYSIYSLFKPTGLKIPWIRRCAQRFVVVRWAERSAASRFPG